MSDGQGPHDCTAPGCDIKGLCKTCWENLGAAPSLRREVDRLTAYVEELKGRTPVGVLHRAMERAEKAEAALAAREINHDRIPADVAWAAHDAQKLRAEKAEALVETTRKHYRRQRAHITRDRDRMAVVVEEARRRAREWKDWDTELGAEDVLADAAEDILDALRSFDDKGPHD